MSTEVENKKITPFNFWMVVCVADINDEGCIPHGYAPRKLHRTYEEAEYEAARLSALHPGQEFVVLSSGTWIATENEPKTISREPRRDSPLKPARPGRVSLNKAEIKKFVESQATGVELSPEEKKLLMKVAESAVIHHVGEVLTGIMERKMVPTPCGDPNCGACHG